MAPYLQPGPGTLAAPTERTPEEAISVTQAVAVQRAPGAPSAARRRPPPRRKPGEHAPFDKLPVAEFLLRWTANMDAVATVHSCRWRRMLHECSHRRSGAAAAACCGAGAQAGSSGQPAPQQQLRLHHTSHASGG